MQISLDTSDGLLSVLISHCCPLHVLSRIIYLSTATNTGAWNSEKRQQRAARMAGHGGGGHGRAFRAAAAAAEEAALAAVKAKEAEPAPEEDQRSPSGLMSSNEWDRFARSPNLAYPSAPSRSLRLNSGRMCK